MGQIIKSVCVCQSVSLSVYVSVRLRALSRSHFLVDFHQNCYKRKKNPKRKKEFVNIAPPLPLFCPTKPRFWPKGPENPCQYYVIIYLPYMYANRRNFRVLKEIWVEKHDGDVRF